MNQQCKVCGEPAAGFHFGAFTCEGCKSFFGRTYNNLSSISECKNNGECVINKKNRTACKACRLRKCLMVGMSKSGSRYGRRSNWFKIHCLLQEQQQQHLNNLQSGKSPPSFSPGQINPNAFLPANLLPAAALREYYKNPMEKNFTEDIRHSASPSDSGGSTADPEDDSSSRSTSALSFFKPASSPSSDKDFHLSLVRNQNSSAARKRKHSITVNLPPSPLGSGSSVASFSPRSGPMFPQSSILSLRPVPAGLLSDSWHTRNGGDLLLCSPAVAGVAVDQDQPIDLSIKSTAVLCRRSSKNDDGSDSEPELRIDLKEEDGKEAMKNPLDLSLVPKRTGEVPLTG